MEDEDGEREELEERKNGRSKDALDDEDDVLLLKPPHVSQLQGPETIERVRDPDEPEDLDDCEV